jgi:hypothetical protein
VTAPARKRYLYRVTVTDSGGDDLIPPDALADAIIAAGWRYDGSCRDCQANLDTNGGRHQFWCQTEAGRAQWADEQHE